MEIILHRAHKKPDYTIGRMYINGKPWRDSVEPTDRNLNMWMPKSQIQAAKVKGKTAIPCGRYRIIVTHSPRFGRPMPLLLGVPCWDGVRIHAGNSASDTEGCICPGENKAVGKVLNSRKAEDELTSIIQKANTQGEECFITII